MLEKVTHLIAEQDICVLATVSDNRPHCSLMAYVVSADGRRIHMATSRSTKKYSNLLRNTSVSLLIDDRSTSEREFASALTLAGTCATMTEGEAKEQVKQTIIGRHPHLSKFVSHPDVDILEVEIESVLLLQGLSESYFERLV
ncbi:putative flavin-nucleotide-binding protein [Desulfocurvibacter africanus PCS]|uniref:Putative flavin-nucleotide-binding protein n=1 Tax=Desulfocurvibacter africanus PCS TaxID=1262666 RepID=M5PXY0_DESAF|nr:pyridoxamine 5'-phosphate oxidase family protein [Desulfocurvibacter africanus]EMG38899.1 putative flavin-nucleotide-binding protein [Desulfocurvibacter africanus PCS]